MKFNRCNRRRQYLHNEKSVATYRSMSKKRHISKGSFALMFTRDTATVKVADITSILGALSLAEKGQRT